LRVCYGSKVKELLGNEEPRAELRNDETIISSISVTDIVFDVYLGKLNYGYSQSENLELFFNHSLRKRDLSICRL
jgi:hypothetical protein